MVQKSVHSSETRAAVLIVEDDPVSAELYAVQIQEKLPASCIICSDSRRVAPILVQHNIDIIILDLHMPHVSGQEVLAQISLQFPDVPVIVVTSEDSIQIAVECMRHGAFDFITKPVTEARLVTAVKHGLRLCALQQEIHELSRSLHGLEIRDPEAFSDIITVSHKMRQIFSYIEAIAPSPKPVLILGDSGTGKELIANVLHRISGRSGAFVPVNVSGLDDTMFSDTMFGHTKGAYTGANTSRGGLVQRAQDGTLFLDEIGDLPMGAQIKLLRLLQEGEYYQLGSDAASRASVRVVAATNANLTEKLENGLFRKDLYYRLMAHTVRLPALKDRVEDIPHLVEHFVTAACSELGRSRVQVQQEVCRLLSGYSFPGNVRELQSLVFDAVSRASGKFLPVQPFREYVAEIHAGPAGSGVVNGGGTSVSYAGNFPTLQHVNDFFIAEALRITNGNQSAAADLLGVSQSTLSRRSRK